MRSLRWLLGFCSLGFFFLNPGVACSDEPDFQYGADELRAVVEGNWAVTITPPDGEPIAVTIKIEQAARAPGATSRAPARGLVRAAYACGTRTLVKSAAACEDTSQMPLALDYVSGDASLAGVPMSGNFIVDGLTFSSGLLYLAVGPYTINAQLSPDGSVTRVSPLATGATVTLSRS